MTEDNTAYPRGKYVALALLVGFLYRVLLSLQGIDHIDQGFSNTFYQNIFTHPGTMTFYFNYYLAGLLGGLWHHCFAASGLLGFRLLEALVLTASVFLVYKSFERQLASGKAVAVAILLCFLFPSIVTTLHYNTLTFFFLSLALWCYSKSLYGKPLLWTYLTGVVLGLCFFVRIVNGSLGILVLVPVVYALSSRQQKLAVQLGGAMLGGMVSAALVLLLLMAALGHLTCFYIGLSEAFGFFSGGETSHASGNLFLVYFKSYLNISLQVVAIVALGALYIQSRRLSPKWGVAARTVLLMASVVLVVTSQAYLSAISLCTLMCALVFLSPAPKEDKFITAFAMTGAYVVPFGSDIGIAGIFHWMGALLIVPAAVGVCRVSHSLRRGAVVFSACIALVMLGKALSFAYGEQSPRWTCTERIGNSVLNTFTSPEKADDYRQVISTIRQFTADNPWLVMGNQASELFYATETLPFLGNTQLGTFTGNDLLRQLDLQLEKYGQKPVVVFLEKEEFVFDEAEDVQATLTAWMQAHNYQTVHKDEYITVFQSR